MDFVPNGYDRILLALTPQRPNIDFGLFIRPFTVQAWRGIGITFAIIITCIILPYMTLRGLHYSNTDRYVIVTVIRVLGFSRGGSKLYIPSTLNITLIQWHTQLNVCAVK